MQEDHVSNTESVKKENENLMNRLKSGMDSIGLGPRGPKLMGRHITGSANEIWSRQTSLTRKSEHQPSTNNLVLNTEPEQEMV